MAYRRSLATRVKVFAQQRFTPSISYLNHHEDRKNSHSDGKLNSFLQSRSFGVVGNNSTSLGFRDPGWSRFRHVPMTASGLLLARTMSTKIAEQIDMADILTNQTMEVVSTQAAPVLSEVAIAAADSWLPVAAVQYAIGGIHVFTGLNWWASIVITTLVIRTLLFPFIINQMKVGAKCISGDEGHVQGQSVFKKQGFWTSSLPTGCLIRFSVFVSHILAITNMVDKVPSFKTGGASWFLDLTTGDAFCVLPCLCAYLYWIRSEFVTEEFLGGKCVAGQKGITMVVLALSVPIMAFLPKALLIHFVASNLFSLVQLILLNDPTVRQILKLRLKLPSPPNSTSL